MNLPRYEFCENSYPSLLKFLEAAKEHTGNNEDTVWKTVLPRNEELLKKIEKYKNANEPLEVIDLCSRSRSPISFTLLNDGNTSDESKNINVASSHLPHEQVSNISIKESADLIIRQISTNGDLSQDILGALSSPPNKSETARIFELLIQIDVSNDCVNKLGRCLLFNDNNTLLIQYFQIVLLEKIKAEEHEKLTEIFEEVINGKPQILCAELAKTLINLENKCPSNLAEILNKLKVEPKQKILREFVLNCSKLEKRHFPIIELLMVNQLDLSVLKKLIEMFTLFSNECNNDREFGKLLLTILQKMEKNVHHFERDLRNIVMNHKSPWKGKILKFFESSLSQYTNNFSQTMLY